MENSKAEGRRQKAEDRKKIWLCLSLQPLRLLLDISGHQKSNQ
ncbi:hypothetical protein [Okeania sp. SIO2B3]|nr:hypothetical protein [Okeania sp. SIO2B3]